MAIGPVSEVVQQGRDQEQLGVFGTNQRGEPLVRGQALQVLDRDAVHAERVLLTRVVRRRVDERHQTQLADPREPAKLRGVDQLPHAWRHGHIDTGGQPDKTGPAVKASDLGQLEQ